MELKPKVLVLRGDGINCERETAFAFELAGGESHQVHFNELLKNPKRLHEYQILALPGGFSFGDELGSGRVAALKLKYGLSEELDYFLASKKPVIGICNGFQILVQLGVFHVDDHPTVSLCHNEQGQFLNQWTELEVCKSPCIWTKDLEDSEMLLPIRHGEGRIRFSESQGETYRRYQGQGMVAMRYKTDINGSYAQIAALTDPSGHILGLMPHPEAFWKPELLPYAQGRRAYPLGIELMKNAINYVLNQ